MNWTEIKHEDYHPIACLDGADKVHHLMFSPISIEVQSTEENPNPGDTKVLFVRTEYKPNIEQVRNMLEKLILEYDKDREINHFNYGNFTYWFSKEERVALKYKFEVLLNHEEYTGIIWFGSRPYEVYPVEVLDFLEDLEYYAIKCNDVTRQHLNEIKNIDNIEDLIKFDITKDYPTPVTINNSVFKH